MFLKITKSTSVSLFMRYTINHNENEDENEKRSHRHDTNRPRSMEANVKSLSLS